jgi:site-specific DNA recombinase
MVLAKKVGIYVRVSTEEQAKEGISIDAQIDRCSAFCKARGWKVHQIYTDAGLSAGTMKRAALQNLLQDAKDKKFEVLLVYKIDRFSRRLRDLITLLDEFKGMDINFSSVTEQIDTTTAMGEAFFQIIGVFAQLERGMVKERVEMSFDKKISYGEALHRAPLGYTYKNSKLVIDKDKASTVIEIFNMRIANVHYKEISEKFNVPVSTLYQILKNPTYMGKVQYKGKLYPGTHPAIISEESFKSVNEWYNGN